jgi:hypothetical protein
VNVDVNAVVDVDVDVVVVVNATWTRDVVVDDPWSSHVYGASAAFLSRGRPQPAEVPLRLPAGDDGAGRHVHFALIDRQLHRQDLGAVVGRAARLDPGDDLFGP